MKSAQRSHTPRVAILLSTFNGAQYLREQMESLLSQTLQPELIFVRDDGSSDGTRGILEMYAASDDRVRLLWGKNVGPAESFLRLIREASDADYFALCDQDDVWLPDKLDRSAKILESAKHESEGVYLYCGAYLVVDKELNFMRMNQAPRREVGLENALVDNVATGCTIVISRTTKTILESCVPDTSKIMMHDWWLYLVASALGQVLWDDQPLLKYRQHGANALGETRGLRLWTRRLRRVTVDKRSRNAEQSRLVPQAEELLRCFGHLMTPERRSIVESFLELANEGRISRRIHCLRSVKVFRQKRLENILLKTLLVFGRLKP